MGAWTPLTKQTLDEGKLLSRLSIVLQFIVMLGILCIKLDVNKIIMLEILLLASCISTYVSHLVIELGVKYKDK